MAKASPIQSQVIFLYYREMETIASFFDDVMGFELVEDQGWAKIYRTGGNAFVGAVSGERGFHQPQEKNAVTVTLVVEDVPGWYEYLREQGVKLLTELQQSDEIQVRGFFFEDPGGYVFEVQQFLKPELARVFHGR
jgi:catechol 2,3-dioxygenase-like lactoylglutathione lyase family enzyme